MKKNRKYFLGLLFLISCMSVTTCKKKSDNTIIKGIVIDSVKNKIVANKKVVVVSCYWYNFLPVCGNLITSTTTNSKGEFELSFDATDNPLGFEVRAGLDSNYYFSASTSEKVIPLQANYITLYAREVSYLKLHLKVLNNPLPPLQISCGNTYHTLTRNAIDTVVYCKVLPNSTTKVIYWVWDPLFNKNRQLIDTLYLGKNDTTLHEFQIVDTRNMPLN